MSKNMKISDFVHVYMVNFENYRTVEKIDITI